MPTQETWNSQATLRRYNYDGRQRTWVVTPHFGALDKDSKPVNPYNDHRLKAAQSSLTYGRYSVSTGAKVEGETNYLRDLNYISGLYASCKTSITSDWFSSARTSMDNAAILKALVKVADAKVNLAVTYAEAHKTSSLILDAARRIDRAYRAFRRGDLRGVANNLNITPRKLHKSWLEYKYGWMPLLMDVKGAAEFFAQQHVVRPPRFQVSASVSRVKAYDKSYTYQSWGGTPNDTVASQLFSCSLEVKCKVWCELSSPHLSELQQLGLTNPALVAWELVPFSFVFDWFIQVGDYLTGLTALQGVTVRRIMLHHVENFGWSVTYPHTIRVNGGYRYDQGLESMQLSNRIYERSIPSYSPGDLHPPMTNSFDFPKLVTSLALLRGSHRGTQRL